ncbi:MAG: 4Fe-4S dicluster domain-containing protein [Desulfobacterales bacterium]|nr:4Fe-4S dicluster domain-containing protein [Desulfobacterales bacterium]
MELPEALIKYAKRLGFPDPLTTGYKALKRVFELIYLDHEDHAKVISAIPGTTREIIEKSGISEERTREIIKMFIDRGGLSGHSKKPGKLVFPVNIGNLKEFNANFPDAPKEFHELMDVLFFEEIHKDSEMLNFVKILDKASVVRVLPVDETVNQENKIMDIDSAHAIFDNADLISAVPCGCRVGSKVANRKANDRETDCPAPKDLNICFQTNSHAARVLKRDIGGEKITAEEAKRRLDLTEEAGLIHMVANVVDKSNSYILCNCCSCCCSGVYWINSGYGGLYAPSRFGIKLDTQACSGCGDCEERCQFSLISFNDEDTTPVIEFDKCYGCGNCVITCPEEALSLEEVRAKDHIHEEDTYFV